MGYKAQNGTPVGAHDDVGNGEVGESEIETAVREIRVFAVRNGVDVCRSSHFTPLNVECGTAQEGDPQAGPFPAGAGPDRHCRGFKLSQAVGEVRDKDFESAPAFPAPL